MNHQIKVIGETIMQIQVLNKDLGFFTATPITVQRRDTDGEILWCNHAEADTESELVHVPNPHGQDDEYTVNYEVCKKCNMFRRENDTEWEYEG